MLNEFLKKYPPLEKWFDQLDGVFFSKAVLRGDPEVITWAEAKFLHAGCGLYHQGGRVWVTDMGRTGEMAVIFNNMLQLVTPAEYGLKGEKGSAFFEPLAPEIVQRAAAGGSCFSDLIKNDPEKAALHLLVRKKFSDFNIYSKQAIALSARKFDALWGTSPSKT